VKNLYFYSLCLLNDLFSLKYDLNVPTVSTVILISKQISKKILYFGIFKATEEKNEPGPYPYSRVKDLPIRTLSKSHVSGTQIRLYSEIDIMC